MLKMMKFDEKYAHSLLLLVLASVNEGFSTYCMIVLLWLYVLIINNKQHVFSSRDKIYKRYTEMIYNFPYTIYIYKELKYRK